MKHRQGRAASVAQNLDKGRRGRMDANRRRRSRVDTKIPACFIQATGEELRLGICNISLKGLLAVAVARLKPGTVGLVRIELSPEALIEVESRIIRSDATG